MTVLFVQEMVRDIRLDLLVYGGRDWLLVSPYLTDEDMVWLNEQLKICEYYRPPTRGFDDLGDNIGYT